MSSLTASFRDLLGAAPAPAECERTQPCGASSGPVLIHDCITGADHTTLLLVKWRQWDTARDHD